MNTEPPAVSPTSKNEQFCKSQYKDAERCWTETVLVYQHNTITILSCLYPVLQYLNYTGSPHHVLHLRSLSSTLEKLKGPICPTVQHNLKVFFLMYRTTIHFQKNNAPII